MVLTAHLTPERQIILNPPPRPLLRPHLAGGRNTQSARKNSASSLHQAVYVRLCRNMTGDRTPPAEENTNFESINMVSYDGVLVAVH